MARNSSLGATSSLFTSVPVIAGCLALGFLLSWFGFAAAPGLLFFAALLGLASRLWGERAAGAASVSVRASARPLFPGEETSVRYRVENKKLLPLVWLELCQPPARRGCVVPDAAFVLTQPEELEVNAGGAGPLYRRRVLFLPPGGAVEWDTVWRASCRGVCPFRSLSVRSGDGFGLTQSTAAVSLSAPPTLVVWPRRVAVDSAPFLRAVWQGSAGRKGCVEDPTVLSGVRDYFPSDSWKRIDWRSAARQDELQVKLFDAIRPANLHFLVDGASFSPDELEDALSVLGSLLLELGEAGVRCGLTLPDTALSPSVTLSPGDAGVTVPDLLNALAAFDGESAGRAFRREELRALAAETGQWYLLCRDEDSLSDPGLLRLPELPSPTLLVLSLSPGAETPSILLDALRGRCAS